ncbi:NAD+ diphosphatase [Natronocella acetinitrilica]|uniref:NAD-capped RNA hydrolase NudC n=1 Tax=Natronocella acetinitrilica TaxID=414046 RepID=A0AAE3G8W1_9GAMM|nr:NAD(+) diphosphatase [Natronocella acetinitrilica]MCP1675957.1 NAD+ diphosphatase [Natronocella acetinitrilica]
MIDNPFDFNGDFRPGVAAGRHGEGLWFLFSGTRLLVEQGSHGVSVLRRPPPGTQMPGYESHFLGTLGGMPCFAAEAVPDLQPSGALECVGLRGLYGRVDHDLFLLAGRAFQILQWDRSHRYCGACGEPTQRHAEQRARICQRCNTAQYPRLTPAMMALVTRGSELLLARSPRFPEGMYSALAGFVEPGESLEACVHREVQEEVGIQVCNLRYFASQSWPFPHSLMVAYVADYADGEIRVDDDEIVDAAWFSPAKLPAIPGELSIAGHLIRAVARQLAKR